jgi:diaminopimelate decarboxylase
VIIIVGTLTSKFGIGLKDDGGEPILEAYKKYSWLTAIMCHVGSQGIPFDLAIQGIKETVDFALAVNKEVGRNQIQVVDIGGGLSVNFSSDNVTPTFEEYSAALREKVPELFDPSTFSLVITEFGRALVAKCGFFASRVEYSKVTGGRRIAIQYAGADTCVRTIYHPKEWPLRVTILGADFELRAGDGVPEDFAASLPGGLAETDLAGPCCIQADIVAHRLLLPPVRRGDTVLLHDVGGYYHSGHTRYNLRQAPSVWSFEDSEDGEGFKWTLLQPAETVEQTLDAFCEKGYAA